MARESESDSRRDIISELPADIKERILERLPIQDAARTALLSTGWRDVWLGYGQIVVDQDLLKSCMERCKNDKTVALVNMINDILLRHAGSVKKFTLCTPLLDPTMQQSDLDRWFLFLSRNGIQELKISTRNWDDHDYKLPYCIVLCRTIKQLLLRNFIFDWTMNACSIFPGLTSLVLNRVQFSDKLNGIVYNIPNLEKLSLHRCLKISNFEIRVPKLESLSIIGYLHAADVRWFTFYLKEIKTFCLGQLGALWLPLEDFVLNLRVIKLYYLDFASRKLFTIALQFLKYSPNLCELEIIASDATYLYDDVTLPEDCSCTIDQDLKMLSTLKIELFRGSTQEMFFVKMILSKSPALEKVVIQESNNLDSSRAVKIPRELLRLPRASPKAQIVYMDYNFRYEQVGYPEF